METNATLYGVDFKNLPKWFAMSPIVMPGLVPGIHAFLVNTPL